MQRSEPAFDLDRALAMVEGDADLLAATARSFLEQNRTRATELGDAVARGDAQTVERIAHGLAGAALNFAAQHLERAARDLVEAAVSRDVPAFLTLFEHLEVALSEISDELSAYCARHELRHVLIAEDDDVTRMRLESLLRKWNYRVTAVSRGDVALELLGAGPPHLAVVDWMLPGLDGLELCRALRARKSDSYTYVILITAKDAPDAIVTGLEAGADDFIAKPVTPAELRVRLRAGERIVELQERLVAAREEQRRQADRDGLTGLLSRRRIFDLLDEVVSQHAATHSPMAVAMVDIDGLKLINENFGHAAGDQVLRAACKRMQGLLREGDAFGRYGGDELLAVMPDTSLAEARALAQRMCESLLSEPIRCEGLTVELRATAGVAETDEDTRSVESLLKAADQALFRAKSEARAL